ncbi:hypothetical protein IZ6_08600 [Terrihabitans soli]|uniref:Peptidase C51 domain-containing protein n=1 Tax=Terrihabitans soli TaxID=708113 RepID=A0A6S6QQU3_9HYPH|nr:CHAP domain-containing protein [Terrihabitans soli]BCJ90125.1 hypothetical protein IZ6_08600 [Terrihabitans soli]
MLRILLAVIVSLCAFASPSLADTRARAVLQEGRSALVTNDDDSRGSGRSAEVLRIAERYIGTNPTSMRRLWCANFLGMVEKKAGRSGSGSNFARSYASYGKSVSRSSVKPGDIAVMARGKRGGHVGYFVGWAPNGKAIIISGNSRGGKVSKGQYAANRIFAWRRPA